MRTAAGLRCFGRAGGASAAVCALSGQLTVGATRGLSGASHPLPGCDRVGLAPDERIASLAHVASPPLRIFAAMPGRFASGGKWGVETVTQYLFKPVCQRLAERLGREVPPVVIEKERREGGVIYTSMYREAFDADVYIADLTDTNPNVCIELGVRLALRKAITIVISQDTSKIPFNVKSLRVIEYGSGPDGPVIDQIVDFVANALDDEDYCDSPVHDAVDLVVERREIWEKLQYEAGLRSDQLLEAALACEGDSERRLELLASAVSANPLSVAARSAYCKELRLQNKMREAIEVASEGITWDPKLAIYRAELGLAYGGIEGPTIAELQEAVGALEAAVALEPDESPSKVEYLCNLGGAQRRLGARGAPNAFDWEMLAQSRASYADALRIDRFNRYAGTNVVRLDLLLAAQDPAIEIRPGELLSTLRHLCEFEAACFPEDHWRLFDLADLQLFSGEGALGAETYSRAIEAVPLSHRGNVLRSPTTTLKGLLDAAVFEADIRDAVERVISDLERSIQDARSAVVAEAT